MAVTDDKNKAEGAVYTGRTDIANIVDGGDCVNGAVGRDDAKSTEFTEGSDGVKGVKNLWKTINNPIFYTQIWQTTIKLCEPYSYIRL